MPTLNHYLLVAGLLFAIGLTGVVLRRNIIIVFMCLELMLSAANLTLITFSRFYPDANGLPDVHGQMLVFFVVTVAAAEVAAHQEEAAPHVVLVNVGLRCCVLVVVCKSLLKQILP